MFKEVVSSKVLGNVKSKYCKNHHCKIVKETIFLELETHCWEVQVSLLDNVMVGMQVIVLFGDWSSSRKSL